MNGLTACLIVRDEEEFLPECLASLRNCAAVSEICVLDTGSTDSTVAVARAGGARVEEWAWRDDFAAARNRTMTMARTDWVLIVDADESLTADARVLSAALSRAIALDLFVIEVDDVRAGRSVGTSPSGRIARRSTMEYRNRVHEILARRDGAPTRGAELPQDVCRLTHTGYGLGQRDARRRTRNLALAEAEVAARASEGDRQALAGALINLGRARAGASGCAVDGLDEWLRAWSIDVPGSFHRWAGELAVSALAEAGRGPETGPLLAALAAEGAGEAQLSWLAAKVFRHARRHAEELACLRRAEGRVTAMGERPSDEDTLALRLNGELELYRYDEAVRTAARLAGGYQRADVLRTLGVLTDAMGPESCEQGARLLYEAARPARAADVRAALAQQQPAARGLADAFDRLFPSG